MRDICDQSAICRANKSLIFLALLVVALALAPLQALGQEQYEVSVEPLLGRIYPPDRWLPLSVRLSNRSDAPVDGAVIMPAVRPAASFRIPASVPAKSVVRLTAYAYLPPTAIKSDTGAQSAPVAIVEWHSANGARLARSELLAQPDTAGKADTGDNPNLPGHLLLSIRGTGDSLRDIQNPAGLLKQLSADVAYPFNFAECEVQQLPRDPAGYGAVRVIVMAGIAPDSLDLYQRRAVLDYVRAGGVLVLSAPLDSANPSLTWLAPYLPVQIIGRRNTAVISSKQVGEVKLIEDTPICEAIAGKGEVLLDDGSLVHAAIQRVGLGRVVFTSFPLSSLDPANTAASIFWKDALQLDHPMPGWSNRAIAQQRAELLEAMVGAPAAPFRHAVWIVAGYVALTLLPQCFALGARRPFAFAVSTLAALLITGGVFFASRARGEGDSPLTMGRLMTVELGSSGGGVKTELVTLLGQDNADLSLFASLPATLQPAASSDVDPPVIEQPPFSAPQAGVRAGRLERMWQATAPVDPSRKLHSAVQIRADGVYMQTDNQTRQTLGAPLLIWNRSAYRLADLPVGISEEKLVERNPPGDFTNAAVVTGESANLRGRIVQAMVSPRTDTAGAAVTQFPPVVVGWADANPAGLSDPLIRPDPKPQSLAENVLVISPVALVPSPPGETVRVPSEFVIRRGDAAKGVLFDPVTGQWLQSILASSWSIGFAIPSDAGALQPIRARIMADLSAGKHAVTLRRGQCANGSPADNPDGPVVARWERAMGPQKAEFEVTSEDIDANGCLWLRLTVEQSGSSGDTIQPQWKLNQFDVEFDARSR